MVDVTVGVPSSFRFPLTPPVLETLPTRPTLLGLVVQSVGLEVRRETVTRWYTGTRLVRGGTLESQGKTFYPCYYEVRVPTTPSISLPIPCRAYQPRA